MMRRRTRGRGRWRCGAGPASVMRWNGVAPRHSAVIFITSSGAGRCLSADEKFTQRGKHLPWLLLVRHVAGIVDQHEPAAGDIGLEALALRRLDQAVVAAPDNQRGRADFRDAFM